MLCSHVLIHADKQCRKIGPCIFVFSFWSTDHSKKYFKFDRAEVLIFYSTVGWKVGRLEGLIVSYFSVWIDRSAPTDMHTDYRHPEIQTTYASILPLHLQSSNNKVEGRNSFAESFAVLSTEKASVKVDIALRCERN